MGELLPYLRLLSERGAAVAFRELRSRFVREDPKLAVRRVMDVCERHNAKFTFFIVGLCARDNPRMVAEILERGHEVACHGYAHQRMAALSSDEIRRDIERALTLFRTQFGFRPVGFRAPYLEMSDDVYHALAEFEFRYSSSVLASPGPFVHPSGVTEIPVAVDDWTVLIKQSHGVAGLAAEMTRMRRPGACFLLHPWRVGQSRYIGALADFLTASAGTSFPRLADAVLGASEVYLSGDIGEFGLWELARRSLSI